MKITALLLLILSGSSEPKVVANAYPGTMAQCLEFIAGRSYKDLIKSYCIPYGEKGAEFPMHVLRDIWDLNINAKPLQVDDVPAVPRG